MADQMDLGPSGPDLGLDLDLTCDLDLDLSLIKGHECDRQTDRHILLRLRIA